MRWLSWRTANPLRQLLFVEYAALFLGPFVYLYVSSRVADEADALFGTAIFIASVVVGRRLLAPLLDWIANTEAVEAAFDQLEPWLLPMPWAISIAVIGGMAAVALAGSLLAAGLYTLIGPNWAALWALIGAASFIVIYLVFAILIFWIRLWVALALGLFGTASKKLLPKYSSLKKPVLALSPTLIALR